MTYAEFLAQITTLLEITTASDTGFLVDLPRIIQTAEAQCFRDLDPLVMRKQATVTIPAGTGMATGPDDWLVARDARIVSGTVSTRLTRVDDTFLAEIAPDTTAFGMPKYWSEIGFQTLRVAPVPAPVMMLQLSYTYQPAPLSETNPVTWLTQWLPELFFAAAMVQGTAYQRNWSLSSDDPRMALSWKQQYDALLLSARHTEGRRKGEGVFDSTQSPPPPVARVG